ncbi:unnamed protein product [Lactuca saligna]|uniref:C-JID domain-containing protein n=1 Tax=Lactuca saligna TaxID=75948 RepID=A0AA36EP07_LACSI|nr:unnamed protein product [Lactuca saligna]
MLPSSMTKLKNVQILSLDGWAARIGKQSHASCSSSSVGEFVPKYPNLLLISLPSSLVTLSLRDSNLSNESFPADFSNMSMLKILYLDENPIDSLPDCVRNLSRLEGLSVMNCSKLKSVLCPPNTVKCLSADHCVSLVKITFSQEITAPPFVHYYYSVSLTEVQGIFKIQAIEKIDDQILCSLGWTHLQHVKDHKVRIWDSAIWPRVTKLPVQMCYEFGIFSTCFPGNVVPDWLGHKNNGSSISFTMPSSSTNKRIEGINICFVHTFSADEDLVWLSHWMFGKNELEDGDEVSVTIVEEEEDGGIMVKECAVSPVYNDRENEEDPLSYYKSWKHIIGRDLSTFQLTSGDYFLIHDRFFNRSRAFKDLFQHKTTQNLFGYIPQYKDENVVTHENEDWYLNEWRQSFLQRLVI